MTNKLENESFVGESDTDFELEELKICHSVGLDVTDRLPTDLHISNRYIATVVISAVCHVADVTFDVNLAYQYYAYCQYTYFLLTALFVVLPSLIICIVSCKMYSLEEEACVTKRVIRFIGQTIQLAPILRYYDLFCYALKSKEAEKKNDYEKQNKYYAFLVKEDSNVSFLRILECLLESAPQQILQIAILLNTRYNNRSNILQGYQMGVLCTSVITIGWSIALYNRSIRFARQDRENLTWPATITQFLWHFLVISARILSISEIASVCPKSTLVVCIFHWVIMSLWLYFYENTQFCSDRDSENADKWMEAFFCFLLGFLYIFVFLTPSDNKTRNKYIVYYGIYFIELCLAVYFWFHYSNESLNFYWWFDYLLLTPPVAFFIGILCMVTYYKYLHPNSNLSTSLCCGKKENSMLLLPESATFNMPNSTSVATQTDIRHVPRIS